jgi:hypothetical protein
VGEELGGRQRYGEDKRHFQKPRHRAEAARTRKVGVSNQLHVCFSFLSTQSRGLSRRGLWSRSLLTLGPTCRRRPQARERHRDGDTFIIYESKYSHDEPGRPCLSLSLSLSVSLSVSLALSVSLFLSLCVSLSVSLSLSLLGDFPSVRDQMRKEGRR